MFFFFFFFFLLKKKVVKIRCFSLYFLHLKKLTKKIIIWSDLLFRVCAQDAKKNIFFLLKKQVVKKRCFSAFFCTQIFFTKKISSRQTYFLECAPRMQKNSFFGFFFFFFFFLKKKWSKINMGEKKD